MAGISPADLNNILICAETALRSQATKTISPVEMSDCWASVTRGRAELNRMRTETTALDPISGEAPYRHVRK